MKSLQEDLVPRGSALSTARRSDHGAAADEARATAEHDGEIELLSRRLRAREDALRMVCASAFDAFIVVDDRRRYVHANQRAADLFGVSLEELLTLSIDDFSPQHMRPELEQWWSEFKQSGGQQGRYDMLRGDGVRAGIEYRVTRDFAPGKHLITVRETPGAAPSGDSDHGDRGLSKREREILQLAADGMSARAIAGRLVVSQFTVKTHFQHIYEKLGAHDRASAVASALRAGIIK